MEQPPAGDAQVHRRGLPVRVVEYNLREDSGGAGSHQGGSGIRRVYEFLAPATITINSERRLYAPYGLEGGTSGKKGENKIVREDQSVQNVSGKFTGMVAAGDRVVLETPGGGGWGSGGG